MATLQESNYFVLTHASPQIHSPFRFTESKAVMLAKHMNELTNTKRHVPIKLLPAQLEHYIPFDPTWKLYDVVAIIKGLRRYL